MLYFLDSRRSLRVGYATTPIPSTICSSDYVVLLTFILNSGIKISRPILITIQNKNRLPSRACLNFVPEILQEKPNFSGAAILSTIKEIYGDEGISQASIREMIDKSRELAGYQPFDTWRILLRRISTSSAHHFSELPEFKNSAH